MKRDYGKKLDADNSANLARSRAGRDVGGDYPPIGNLERRERCRLDFKAFCEVYFPAAFTLPWSSDHLVVLARIQATVLDGGLFALAMPRGSGKTTLCERAALWALLYGHRRFVCLIGATESAAETSLEHIKTELMLNDLLAGDFRQVCHCIRKLENNARKCIGQLLNGEQTRVNWSSRRLTFPTLPDDLCDGINVSGATITVAGLTGALRGQSHVLASGEITRPELVILDDPQTRESALSPSQSAHRVAIVLGDVLGMAGPGQKVAAIMPCTVVRSSDMADQLLDRQQSPSWQGQRTKAVYSWPTNEKVWEQYHNIRNENLRQEKGATEATEFYKANRESMDAGAVVAWPERFNPDELSAVQHVVNTRADIGEEAFQAEYQNEPIRADAVELPTLSAVAVAEKVSGLPRGKVSAGAQHLTMSIDVHDSLLYWCIADWSGDFTGNIVLYGTWPEQKRSYFTLRKANPTLSSVLPGAGREAVIQAGLNSLCLEYLGKDFQREDGAIIRIGKCLIDSGYVTDLVFEFCRRSSFASILMPSRGVGIGAAKTPIREWTAKPGERHGWFWVINRAAARAGQHVRFDTNHWKSFVHGRFTTALGDKGGLSLFGDKANDHRLFSEHITAEQPIRVTANGRTVDEWTMRPGFVDNHWLDCTVGCSVAASILGASIEGASVTKPKRRRVSFAEMQQAAKGRRLTG